MSKPKPTAITLSLTILGSLIGLLSLIVLLSYTAYYFTMSTKHTYVVDLNGDLLPKGYRCIGEVAVHKRGGNLLDKRGNVVGCLGEVRLDRWAFERWENSYAK